MIEFCEANIEICEAGHRSKSTKKNGNISSIINAQNDVRLDTK